MSLENMVVALAQTAKKAARILATVSTHTKNQALLAAAQQLRDQTEVLLTANAQDVARGKDNGLSAALLDRLLHHTHPCQTSGDSIRLTQALAGEGVMPLEQ